MGSEIPLLGQHTKVQDMVMPIPEKPKPPYPPLAYVWLLVDVRFRSARPNFVQSFVLTGEPRQR